MALSDHLRELRSRVLKMALVVVVGLIVSLFFFDPLFQILYGPYERAAAAINAAAVADGRDPTTLGTTSGPGAGLLLYLKVCGLSALIATSPFWLYQIWAFILPGLRREERKWTRIFAAVAGPLFLVGIALGYVTLQKGLEVLIGFNPDGLTNLIEFNDYLTFFSRTMLVFGIAFEIPVFVVLLNMAGIVKGKALGAYRPWIIVGTFIFAAIATPSADPFTMTFMAVPMVLLFFISEVIARVNDRRRDKRRINAGLAPDEQSVI